MDLTNRLNELLSKVDNLTNEVKRCHEEIDILKNEITNFKGKQLLSSTAAGRTKISLVNKSPAFENFIGLKLINFVGIIVLIIGLTIGVKYAIDINLISPAMRIILTYVAAIALFFISLNLRKKYELFSIILFSGSVASSYFTTYAAFEYYALISRPLAFILMLLFTFFTVYSSLKYNRQEIAILGLVGAYGIPFFVKGNSDNVIALFSYIFLINTGVLIISFKKYWLSLNYISFFTTWLIYLSWAIISSGKNDNVTANLFCYGFFIFFILNSLVFKAVKRLRINLSDTFIILTNTVFFYFSLIMLYTGEGVRPAEYITLYFGITYMLTAIIVKRILPTEQHLYNGLFSVALTALVAFAGIKYMAFMLTIVWVVMAVFLFIAGMIYRLKLFRIASILLFGITLLKLLLIDSAKFNSGEKVIAYIFIGIVLLIISFLYQKFRKNIFGEDGNGDM